MKNFHIVYEILIFRESYLKHFMSYRRKTCNKNEYLLGTNSNTFICWTPLVQLNIRKSTKWRRTRFSALNGTLFLSKSSWTPETRPNDALRRCLFEFVVFILAFGRWRELSSGYYIKTIIHYLRLLKKWFIRHSQFPKNSFMYTLWNVKL